MFDPNSTVHRAPEVRVTMRGERITENGSPVQVSTRSDFVAPELSAPSTSALEQSKGLRGWTAGPVPADKRPQHLIRAEKARKALALADAQALVVGTAVIRHTAPSKGRAVSLDRKRRIVPNRTF